MRRALLLLVLFLAGCHATPVFDGPSRLERSRYYAIRTDVAAETSFSLLDRAVERVSARFGIAPPPPGALEAIVFETSDRFHAFRDAHRASGGAGAVGFYCPRGKEIALSSIALSAAALSRDLDRFGDEMDRRARDRAKDEAELGTVARELSELARELARKHRELEPVFRAEDLQTIVHEVVHQLMDREELLDGPPWLVEGMAELGSTTALAPSDIPEPVRPVWEVLCSRRHELAAVVLASRAATGEKVFARDDQPTWEDANYAAHLGLVTWLDEHAPGESLRMARGRELSPALAARIELELPRWARVRATERLLGRARPEARVLLSLLWSAPPEADFAALAAVERRRLTTGEPALRPLAAEREPLDEQIAALYPLEGNKLLERRKR